MAETLRLYHLRHRAKLARMEGREVALALTPET